MKTPISSNKAPKAADFYSHAVLSSCKYRLEVSGQLGLNPDGSGLVGEDLTSQTLQAFENIKAILSEVGWDLSNITKCRVYLVDMNDYQEMNQVYIEQFSEAPPARVAMAVKELPLGAKVEIECIAEGNTITN